MGGYLGLRSAGEARFCSGRYGFVDGTGIELVACPRQEVAVRGDQCDACFRRDDFRLAHQVHRGGYTPDSVTAYMAQPHWVYVATFADATSKVGTVAEVRKTARLDEQGPTRATYVARVPDGRVARVYEDALTESLALPQLKRRSAKVTALACPAPIDHITSRHQQVVALAHEVLASSGHPNVQLPDEPWTPPPAVAPFYADVPPGGRPVYPHDLRTGEHGFHVDAVAGSALLARITDAPDALRYVVDLGSLKGFRILVGDFVSAEAAVQESLF